MNDIKRNAAKMISTRKFDDRVVVLFSLKGMMYEVAKILVANNIVPYVLNYVTSKHDLNGIFKNISIKDIKKIANVIILISSDEYFNNRLFFEKNQLRLDKELFVDCKKRDVRFLKKTMVRNYSEWIVSKRNNLFILKKIFISLAFYYRGLLVSNKIRKSSGAQIYFYDYTGIGDVYVLSLFFKQRELLDKDKKEVLVVRSKTCYRVAKLCGIENVEYISEREMKYLTYYARKPHWQDDFIHDITPFPNRIHTDIYSGFLYGQVINMADAYRCVMFDLYDKKVEYPAMPGDMGRINDFFSKNELERGNTVIIAPYANTVIGFPMSFWKRVAYGLKKEGFNVCTNVVGDEIEISGTIRGEFMIEDAERIIDQAGFFLALRSGLCDVVCNSSAYKCLIYPCYHIFNSSVYDFCSFKKMRLGRNYSEIKWGYKDLVSLAEILVSKMVHARYARLLQKEYDKQVLCNDR